MNRLIVVSLPKCGTNLVGALFRSLGYTVTGEGIDNQLPSWCERLDGRFITQFPPDTCCVFHTLNLSTVDAGLVSRWRARREPRVVFNYRDPRAALVSMINYLLSGAYSGAAWQQVGADILADLAEDERIAFGIDYFEPFVFAKFRESAWLLRHPHVLCCSFERLVGAQGGGDDAQQRREVARLTEFAGCQADVAQLARSIFDPRSRTFFSGRRDGWQERFTAADLKRFDEKYGDVLETFGYPAGVTNAHVTR
jgi:hypothetical protein